MPVQCTSSISIGIAWLGVNRALGNATASVSECRNVEKMCACLQAAVQPVVKMIRQFMRRVAKYFCDIISAVLLEVVHSL